MLISKRHSIGFRSNRFIRATGPGGQLRALRFLPVLFLYSVLLAGCEPDNPPITVANDLGFAVTVAGCDGRGALLKTLTVKADETKVLTPGKACQLYGPRQREGPGSIFVGTGSSYIGCLAVPTDKEARRRNVTIRFSRADKETPVSVCHSRSAGIGFNSESEPQP
jgi:hypothetical protein